ncbi:hypothetical protein WT02_30755 [Burkholderia stagnalis]|nr:hypothetical protein WT02_30755 [Burkholderia stagnalis]KVL92523.1 hypothetical protein WT03_01245 [Burkholderia stagnalis]KVM11933.1 hypothetical protein WT04_13040 [Burkholderia stagnalis]
MMIQRLSIRAAAGKLKVIAVWRCLALWRCLAHGGARVCRWSMEVERGTGVESMTVDVIGSRSLSKADIVASLGEAPLCVTITPIHLEVVSNPGAAYGRRENDPREAVRRHPALKVVGTIADPIAFPERH